MPPSQLAIATSSLSRLVREEASYHKELDGQYKRLADLEKSDPSSNENLEFEVKQQKKAIQETKDIFPTLRERIANTREKLQAQLESTNDAAEVEKAKEVLAAAIEKQKDDPNSQKPASD